MPTETVNAKLLGALIAWLGSVTLAITFCYLVLRKKANPRLRTILLLGLFASVLWMCGYGFATTLVIRGIRGSVGDIVYLPLVAGTIVALLSWVLLWIYRAGGLGGIKD